MKKWAFSDRHYIDSSSIHSPTAYNLDSGHNLFQYSIENGMCRDTNTLKVIRYSDISILEQPINTGVTSGIDTTLELKVDGEFIYAQWYKDDNILTNGIKYLGVNNLKLQIRNTEANDAGNYYCIINGNCNDLKTDIVLLEVSVSTFDLNKNDFIIYPNPTENTLFIKTNKEITSIKILNTNGKEALFSTRNHRINISTLDSGTYIVKVISNNKVVYKKILKL